MLKGSKKEEIIKKMKLFLTPETTKSHGRSIFYEEATKCGLNIDLMELDSALYKMSYELFVRLDNYTKTKVAKCLESKKHSFAASIDN